MNQELIPKRIVEEFYINSSIINVDVNIDVDKENIPQPNQVKLELKKVFDDILKRL